MSIDSNTILFLMVESILIACSFIKQQRFSLWIFLMGTALLLFVVFTVVFKIYPCYDKVGLNVYFIIILGIMLTFAGGLGLLVRLSWRFFK
jgi:hypothetical protein